MGRKDYRRIELILDGKKILTHARSFELKIDGTPIYRFTESIFQANKSKSRVEELDIDKLKVLSVQTLLKGANAIFGHVDRFKIVRIISDSPKSFTEIKRALNISSSTASFHLKKLIEDAIIYKTEEGKYAVTLLGKLLLDFFSRFLFEVERLGKPYFSRDNTRRTPNRLG